VGTVQSGKQKETEKKQKGLSAASVPRPNFPNNLNEIFENFLSENRMFPK